MLIWRILLFTTLGVVGVHIVMAQENISSGARSLALGHANTTLTDIWSINNNPSGISHIDHFTIGITTENRFSVSDLALHALHMAIPLPFGTLGFSYQQFGYADYHENRMGCAYGVILSSTVRLGMQIAYHHTGVLHPKITSQDILSTRIGLQVDQGKKTQFGFFAAHLVHTQYTRNLHLQFPITLRFGVRHELGKDLSMHLDIDKNINLPATLRMAFEFQPYASLFIRGGISTHPFHLSSGIGINQKGIQIDLGLSHTPYLGYIYQLTLSYTIQKT